MKKADLKGILEPIEPIPLHISEVVHEALIEIDEKGTEAAAVTRKYINYDVFSS